MRRQRVPVRESLATNLAAEDLLFRVKSAVSVQVAVLTEALAARFAPENKK